MEDFFTDIQTLFMSEVSQNSKVYDLEKTEFVEAAF